MNIANDDAGRLERRVRPILYAHVGQVGKVTHICLDGPQPSELYFDDFLFAVCGDLMNATPGIAGMKDFSWNIGDELPKFVCKRCKELMPNAPVQPTARKEPE